MKILAVRLLLLLMSMFLSVSLVGCKTSQMDSGGPALSLVEPATSQVCLADIPVPKYTVKAKDEQGNENSIEFFWPWYSAIGGKIQNESGVFERAAAGQIDQSTIVGMATRKYFQWSAHRAKAVRVAPRDSFDWNEIRKVLLEVAGEGTLLTNLTPLPKEVIEAQVYRQHIPPELYITGALTEVTVAEESSAGGITFGGAGISGKVVQTSVAGSLEITDPYTGEQLIAVMGQNRVTAEQIGAEVFRIVSFGGDEEFLNVEFTTAKEMVKQQVQVELVDFLFYKAFTELFENRPEYITNRLHYRVGRIQGYAQQLAAEKGLTIIGQVAPVLVVTEKHTNIVAEKTPENLDAETIETADTPAEEVSEEIDTEERANIEAEKTAENLDEETSETADAPAEEVSEQINTEENANIEDEQTPEELELEAETSETADTSAEEEVSEEIDKEQINEDEELEREEHGQPLIEDEQSTGEQQDANAKKIGAEVSVDNARNCPELDDVLMRCVSFCHGGLGWPRTYPPRSKYLQGR
jgi:hypothetical protein